ncbi:type VI secretion system secreted protein VgrG [Paraburkholderia sp. GAS199]|uniref:type VI secretion system Vgr family protein n=1 Tax=Paraburkholderia sp. GAS199 TaxID=3035126 RepID=UPI003D215D5F
MPPIDSWNTQARVLDITGEALPRWRDEPIFLVSRLRGREKLGYLYEYDVDISTIDHPDLDAWNAQSQVDVDALIGKEITIRVAVEGKGTLIPSVQGDAGGANIGADIRKITGLIAAVQCLNADDRHAFYRLKVRPWLWLATLNRNSQIWQGRSIVEISEDILRKYPFPLELRLAGPGMQRHAYPKRSYQRQWWESDYSYLSRIWQEWGITFFFERSTLVLCDSPGAYRKHDPAYATLRYLDRNGQRIDEEHIHKFRVGKQITTGKVSLTDYDYTQSNGNLAVAQQDHNERTFDNAEEYAWGDYSQPLEGPMGVSGTRNDTQSEGEHLARVKVEAHRAKSVRAKGKGNLRGLMVGYIFALDGYPLTPGDGEYLVVSTDIEIVNNDTATQDDAAKTQSSCKTRFSAIPANSFYRTPQKARKPRAHPETAIVTGYGDEPVYCDQYGRVKAHFVWDRLSTKDENASCWLRVASPWHGAAHGAIWLPRVGHHVLVGYLDGDPDRPYIISEHTTEEHQAPWQLPKNEALSGWRSQELRGQSSNSVVTDDTPGQLQVQISSDHAQSRLVLGYNTRLDGHHGRDKARGEGFELATEAHGVVRSNRGLLVTTEARTGTASPANDMVETVQRLTQAHDQHADLCHLAQKHDAQSQERSQSDVTLSIRTQNDAIKGAQNASGNPSPEMTRADMVLASAAGIATTARESTHQASQHDHAVTAGRDISMSGGRSLFATVRDAISLFAVRSGIRLFSDGGKVELHAQSDNVEIIADQVLKLISAKKRIEITAAEEILLQARGSYVRINGAGIEHGTPAKWVAYAGSHALPGPKSLPASVPGIDMPKAFSNRLDVYDIYWPRAFEEVEYIARRSDGEILTHGTLDNDGRTARVYTDQEEAIQVLVGTRGAWLVETDADNARDKRDEPDDDMPSDQESHYVYQSA